MLTVSDPSQTLDFGCQPNSADSHFFLIANVGRLSRLRQTRQPPLFQALKAHELACSEAWHIRELCTQYIGRPMPGHITQAESLLDK